MSVCQCVMSRNHFRKQACKRTHGQTLYLLYSTLMFNVQVFSPIIKILTVSKLSYSDVGFFLLSAWGWGCWPPMWGGGDDLFQTHLPTGKFHFYSFYHFIGGYEFWPLQEPITYSQNAYYVYSHRLLWF